MVEAGNTLQKEQTDSNIEAKWDDWYVKGL